MGAARLAKNAAGLKVKTSVAYLTGAMARSLYLDDEPTRAPAVVAALSSLAMATERMTAMIETA